MLADTSKQAYKSLDKIGAKQRRVLEVVEEFGPITNHKIAQMLGWEINRITGRVHELAEMGKIEVAYIASSDTGRKAKFWDVTNKEQRSLF